MGLRTYLLPRLGLLLALAMHVAGCSGVEIDPAVAEGPLARPDDPVRAELAAQGETLFRQSCAACHTFEGPLVGPSLAGIVERRSPEWIRGMVLNPDSMLRHDAEARALMASYPTRMVDTGLDELHFRALWEYLRAREGPGGAEEVEGTPGATPP
jgi:mono/diheme cytochrome c family protein